MCSTLSLSKFSVLLAYLLPTLKTFKGVHLSMKNFEKWCPNIGFKDKVFLSQMNVDAGDLVTRLSHFS